MKSVVPTEVSETLKKRTSKDLYYVGLDIKANAIDERKLKELEQKGVQLKDCSLQTMDHDLLESKTLTSIKDGEKSEIAILKELQMVKESVTPKIGDSKKRGRPKKVVSQPESVNDMLSRT